MLFRIITCMLAFALTMGLPIRRRASQTEETVPIGGNVSLLCPFIPNDLWKWVNWMKDGHTIYSLEYKSNTTTTNDTRYEGSNHATRLKIKDLKKTDSGIYHCKVVTILSTKERGHVLLSVTDQEPVELSTTSPSVPFKTSTTIPPQPAEDKLIFLVFLILIPIIFIVCLVYKYWEGIKNLPAGCVNAFRRLAPKRTSTPSGTDSSHHEYRDEAPISSSTPLGPDSSHHEIREEAPISSSTPLDPDSSHHETRDEAPISSSTPLDPVSSHHETRDENGTRTDSLSSDTHDRDDVDVDDNQNRVQNRPVQGRRYGDPYTNPNRWQPYF